MSDVPIGQHIREIRKMRQLSVRQLASRVAISVSALEKYERGDRTPSPGLVVQIAGALRVGPERLYGQPFLNGAEREDQVQAVIPDLRRILLTYDNPDDLITPARPLPVLAAEVDQVAQMRQDGRYVPMGPLLPGLLAELTHRALVSTGREQKAAYWWLARAYRATNSLAHKLGYHDLSLTAVERVHWAADRSGDPLMQVTGAYLRAGAMLRLGSLGSARRILEGLTEEITRLSPESSMPDAQAALQGAVLLKLAILEARDRRADQAWARLHEARAVADLLPGDTTYYEMSFGPTNVRIHEVAALIETGDTRQALAKLKEWGGEQDREDWKLPETLAAERASHHHIDVASARLSLGDSIGAHQDLLRARRLSPNHARFHPTVRQTASVLVRMDRREDDSIAGFARWAGI